MRAHSIVRKKAVISRREELRTLTIIVVATLVPLLGALVVVSTTSRPDLADLVPIQDSIGGFAVLNWSALETDRSRSKAVISPFLTGAPVQALGYMVDGDSPLRDGDWVQHFVLLPEAGNFLHPAHRLGDQMIEIRLRPGARVRFAYRSLVWVSGTFRALAGDPDGSEPLYLLDSASAQPAGEKEIPKYFR